MTITNIKCKDFLNALGKNPDKVLLVDFVKRNDKDPIIIPQDDKLFKGRCGLHVTNKYNYVRLSFCNVILDDCYE